MLPTIGHLNFVPSLSKKYHFKLWGGGGDKCLLFSLGLNLHEPDIKYGSTLELSTARFLDLTLGFVFFSVAYKKVIKEPNDKSQKKEEKKEKSGERLANGNSSDSDVAPVNVDKEKVKKRKTNFKLKKESKQLRLNAMSEGFKYTNFSVKPEINIDRAVNGNSNGNKMLNGKKTEKRKRSMESPGKQIKKIK